jgi:hypothetical protein
MVDLERLRAPDSGKSAKTKCRADVTHAYHRPHDQTLRPDSALPQKRAFSKADISQLTDLTASVKGKMLLSINDTHEIRKIFAGFHPTPVQVTYTVSEAPLH